ncbi:MAG: NUDIX hydrolase [Arenicellales bacterium]|jgi:8-oxo-dGTP pyrophosphatase MutT (NUDIX family)
MKTVLIFMLSLWTGIALANPAGVIPYACVSGEPYVLLAFDPVSDRVGYSAFGGGRRGNETIAETAAREFHEETRCVFDKPTASELEVMTPSEVDGFYSYVVQVPFIPHLEIPEHPCEARIERLDWQWIRLRDLIEGLNSGEARPKVLASLMHKYITLWEGGAETLRKAIKDGLLGLENICH